VAFRLEEAERWVRVADQEQLLAAAVEGAPYCVARRGVKEGAPITDELRFQGF